jgi:hypothetical protein
VGNDTPAPIEPFETWLLRRVAKAVEAGEVSAALLAELQAEIETAKEKPQEEGHAEAVHDIAARLDIPLGQAKKSLAAIDALPTVTREFLLRRFVEAWLGGQPKASGCTRRTASGSGLMRHQMASR